MSNTVTITLTQEQAELVYGYLQDLAYDGEALLYDEDHANIRAIVDSITDTVYPIKENP